MSTKNLARTAIEGGRRNKWKRRTSTQIERTANNQLCRQYQRDPELWEEEETTQRQPVSPDFSDKLSPVFRFLRSRSGEVWDEVYSEIRERFDTRTTPGRHIVEDHLMRELDPDIYWYGLNPEYRTYRIQDGILVYRPRRARKYHRAAPVPEPLLHKVAKWAGGRMIGQVGSVFFWYIIQDHDQVRRVVIPAGRFTPAGLQLQYLGNTFYWYPDFTGGPAINRGTRQDWVPYPQVYCCRQHHRLDREELEFWDSLPQTVRNQLWFQKPA